MHTSKIYDIQFFPWQLMSKLFIQYLSPILFPHNPKYDLKYLEFNRLLFDRKITGPYLETLTVCYCLLGAFSYWLKNLMTSKFWCRCHFSMLVYSPSWQQTDEDVKCMTSKLLRPHCSRSGSKFDFGFQPKFE